MKSGEIRHAFLEFFASRGHELVASGPLVPRNDPTLLFANAGMVQFKDVFTGKETRGYTRATSSQKCLRLSGKHNDLEEVGSSLRHQTFFEMLGNFSFGDYFKEEAIVFAWEFLTGLLGLPKERLLVTYFKGEGDVGEDVAARDLWKRVAGFGDDRIIGLGLSDNFWQMGETGPCGPCSELHYYYGPDPDPRHFGEPQSAEGHGWVEFWNLVFMQFERRHVHDGTDGKTELGPLPAPCIDTGMGLERLATILQGQTSNYETDLLRALVDKAASLSGKRYGGGTDPDDTSMRVIADHARTTAFLIAEGVLPDRTGREYVLRRVLRRAVRHGHRLGIERPFLHEVALEVVALMGDHYKELVERRDLIASVIEAEEVRFRQTVERGLGLLEERFVELASTGNVVLAGADAFKLYDTFGFPVDLTEVICRERGFSVDMNGYEAALEDARRRSEFKGMEAAIEAGYREALARVPSGATLFTGYERDVDRSSVVALIVDGKLVASAGNGSNVGVVTAKTPFYGAAGGQVGDEGVLVAEGARVVVTDTERPLTGLIVHHGRVEGGELVVGAALELRVHTARRERIRRNHSATHLLHLALRRVLGAHAQQKGSLVGPDRLRFDFTHGKPLTSQELAQIEEIVNGAILHNDPVHTEVLSMDEARQRGAMMIFEEKYGDVVRMLTMGESVELCGGTHARATGDIGLFKILSETGIAAGVRRLVATTGLASLEYVRGLESELGRAALAARAGGADLADKIEKLVARERELEKEVKELERRLSTGAASGGIEALLGRAREIGGVKVLGVRAQVKDRGALRELAESLRDRLGESIVLVGSESDGKAQLVLTVSKPIMNRFRAGEMIRSAAEVVGGSGGGRPDMAQAGGTDVAKLDQAIESVYSAVQAMS